MPVWPDNSGAGNEVYAAQDSDGLRLPMRRLAGKGTGLMKEFEDICLF
jgi:hypothetical protein